MPLYNIHGVKLTCKAKYPNYMTSKKKKTAKSVVVSLGINRLWTTGNWIKTVDSAQSPASKLMTNNPVRG